jgi:hypothetical protein
MRRNEIEFFFAEAIDEVMSVTLVEPSHALRESLAWTLRP